MQAIFDLTEGAPVGTFMSLLVRELIVKTAMVENIFAQWLTITEGGGIKSNALINGERTFEVDGDTGILKAVGGSFKQITIDDTSIMKGDIDTGVLKVLPSSIKQFNTSGHTVNSFWDYMRSQLGYSLNIQSFIIYPTGGTFSGQPIISIFFNSLSSTSGSNVLKSISINNGTANFYLYFNATVLPSFTFTAGTDKRTLRLEGLPTFILTPNEVYKKYNSNTGEYTLMIM
jgi:hypothetical protein